MFKQNKQQAGKDRGRLTLGTGAERRKLRKIRTNFIEPMSTSRLLNPARVLVDAYKQIAKSHMIFEIPELPPSLNHQYGRRADGGNCLKQHVKDFRMSVLCSIGQKRWRPEGVFAAVILFESPGWITKAHLVRIVDVDNKVKPLLDAIEKATQTPDELVWHAHIFKIVSAKTRTITHLFDLGDIIDVHG